MVLQYAMYHLWLEYDTLQGFPQIIDFVSSPRTQTGIAIWRFLFQTIWNYVALKKKRKEKKKILGIMGFIYPDLQMLQTICYCAKPRAHPEIESLQKTMQ